MYSVFVIIFFLLVDCPLHFTHGGDPHCEHADHCTTSMTVCVAAIVYWDSDAESEPLAGKIGADGIASIREKYVLDLDALLKRLVAKMPGKVVLAGPTLYGELPRGENKQDAAYDGEGGYLAMNRQACAGQSPPVTFVDTRAAFYRSLNRKVPVWTHASGYLTIDGEHHNKRGAQIVTDMFYRALNAFYKDD